MDLYDGAIRYGDVVFQRVMGVLESEGLAGETLVIYTSDHGEAFAEHENWYGHTGTPYIEKLRIPLVMAAPGILPEGVRRGAPVSILDLAPTILSALRLPAEPQFDGISAWPLALGASGNPFWTRPIYALGGSTLCLIQFPWTLLFDSNPDKCALYFANDFRQAHNVAHLFPAIFLQLAAQTWAWEQFQHTAAEAIRKHPTQPVRVDTDVQEILRGMGYF
jgi:hypothetical protein